MVASRIIITGSEGLIGTGLREALSKLNIDVRGFDKKLALNHIDFGDVNNIDNVLEKIRDCDGIIHLAAVSRVAWGERQPQLCWQTNVDGTRNVLEAARSSSKKPWVLFASSREVYGQQFTLPVLETANLSPLNTYAQSKAAAENLIQQYQAFDLNTAILRFSNVYGTTADHSDRVVPAFCRASAYGESMRIDGFDNTFDFTHISDVVAGIVKAVQQLQCNKTLPIMHLTTSRPTTLHQLAVLARQAGNSNCEFIPAPSRTYDVARFYGDFSLAQKVLNWMPTTSIESGVAQLVTDFLTLKAEAFT